MSDEDQKEIPMNNNNNIENNEIKTNEEKIINANDNERINKEKNINNEKLMIEFEEYFNNNLDNKDNNIFNSLNLDNIKELSEDEVNKLPFILNKDQFYQSFVLFQKYLYWNMHRNYIQNLKNSKEKLNQEIKNNYKDNKINDDKINEKKKAKSSMNSQEKILNTIKYKNTQNSSLEIKREESINYSPNRAINENKIINQKKNYNNKIYEEKRLNFQKNTKKFNYDDRPIKSSHRNFLELLEKTLAKKDKEFFDSLFKGKIRLCNKSQIKKNNNFTIENYIFNDTNRKNNKINKDISCDRIIIKSFIKNY